MGRQDHVVELAERVALRRQRLLGVDVERGARNAPRSQRVRQSCVVDERAPPGVDEIGARLHERKLARAHQAAHLGRVAQVDRHDVGAAKDVVTLANELHAQPLGAGDIVREAPGDDVHAEGPS